MQKTVYHMARAIVKVAMVLWLGRASAAPPAIGPVQFVSPAAARQYEKLELAFPVQTDAANVFVPYEAKMPAYAANLKPDEDARAGVSVDALLLPPGVTNWQKARVQPAFYFHPYAPAEPAPPRHPTDLLLVNGKPDWRVRFAPDRVGVWHYKLRAQDKHGTAFSPIGTFSCTPSNNAGFVRVSPTDTRYLVRDSGQVCAFVGDNFQERDDIYHAWAKFAAEHGADGAQCLLRVWLGGRNGLEVYGGFANSDGGRTWSFTNGDGPPCVLRGDTSHAGRFSVQIRAGGTLRTAVPVRPNTPCTVSAWVKTEAGAASLHVGARPAALGGDVPGAECAVTRDWARVSYSVPPRDPARGAAFFLSTEFRASGGPVLVDDITVTGPDGQDALGVGDWERHVRPNPRQAWLLDNVVETAARNGQFLRLVCFDNDDGVYCTVDGNGKPAPHDDANFYGRTNDSRADLPVRRWQRYAVRYFAARYGYSTSIAQWEFCNEGPSYNGNHYAAAQNFGRAVHSFAAQGHRLAGTSFYQNSSAPSYVPEFYENPLYPDMDYADVHYYPGLTSNLGSFVPFNNDVNFFAVRGFSRDPSGGPNGWGRLTATAPALLPWKGRDPNFGAQQFPVFRVRGKGTWTLSGWFRQSADAHFDGLGPVLKLHVPSLGEWACGPGITPPRPSSTPPHQNGEGPASFTSAALHERQINSIRKDKKQNPAVVSPSPFPKGEGWRSRGGGSLPNWTQYSAAFTVPDNADHTGATLRYEATGLKAGQVEFSGVQLTGPDGRDRVRIRFNEPVMDTDTAALCQYLPLDYTGLSGDIGIGKPLSIGESDYLDNNLYNPDLARDVQGVWLRQWTWAHLNPSGAVVFWWGSPTVNRAGEHGWWRYAAAYGRFLADVPLANGRYRNLDAQADNPDVQIIGQADAAGARAHFFVYNSADAWHAQAVEGKRPDPHIVTVTVRGLPDGPYSVQKWSTARGVPDSIQTVWAHNNILRVPVSLWTGDAAVKISKFTR